MHRVPADFGRSILTFQLPSVAFLRGKRALCLMASVLLLLGASCARPPLTPPDRGGPAWTEARTDHFVIYSDSGLEKTRVMAEQFERSYAALENAGFPNELKPTGRSYVIHFDRFVDYQRLTGALATGVFTEFSQLRLEPEPTMLFSGSFDEDRRRLFQHELTHRFVAYYYPASPIWLNEGFAEFFSTLDFSDGRVVLGRPIETRHNIRMRSTSRGLQADDGWPSLSDLTNLSREQFYTGGARGNSELFKNNPYANYVAAWALVHTLSTEDNYREAFSQYLKKVNAAQGPARIGLAQVLTADEWTALKAEYQKKLTAREVKVLTVPENARGPSAIETRVLSTSDVHLLWAKLRGLGEKKYWGQMKSDLRRSLETDPNNVRAWIALGVWHRKKGEPEIAKEHFARALELEPMGALALQATFMMHLIELEAQLDRGHAIDEATTNILEDTDQRLESVATTAGQWRLLAVHDMYTNRPQRGLERARKALTIDGFCGPCWATASALYEANGDFARARDAVRIVIGLQREGEVAAELFERLNRLEIAALQQPTSPPKLPAENEQEQDEGTNEEL